MRFQGKHAMVTGAGSGIGRGVALRFAQEGASVSVADIAVELGMETVRLIVEAGGEARFVQADVSSEEDVVRAVGEARAWKGTPDILVNNAGIIRQAPALETPVAVFDLVIAVNLRSVFLMATEVARFMVREGIAGRIVNMSSIHAVVSEPNACAYTASKGAIEAFSRTLASELAPHRITVNCVRPGATWTALSEPFYSDDVVRALNSRIPLGVIAQPKDIAAAVCYLASDEACYSTGTTLAVDGGYIMDGSLPGTAYI